jgi:hypothetical protein
MIPCENQDKLVKVTMKVAQVKGELLDRILKNFSVRFMSGIIAPMHQPINHIILMGPSEAIPKICVPSLKKW